MAAAAFAHVLLGSCAPSGPPSPTPEPVPEPAPPPAEPPAAEPPRAPPPQVEAPAEPGEPELAPGIRVGLAVGAASATVGGEGELLVTDPAGARLAVIPSGETWRLGTSGAGVRASSPNGTGSASAERLVLSGGAAGQPVRVNARSYHGLVEVLRDRSGLTLVNRLGLEEYLRGVVSAEMGRRSVEEAEALRAQVIVSRTYALRNMRRWAAQGFDLYATVADQVYGGRAAETPEGDAAVAATRGRVLTFGGEPIDAFFYSTCGGRTAQGTEVFRAADRPYLRSVSDLALDGTAYCRLSPRYRWREEWTGEALRATLRRTLPPVSGTPADQVRAVKDVRVVYRTGSGRVGRLGIGLGHTEVLVEGPAVRGVLRAPSGEILRSNAFELAATGAGHEITRLVADGSGAGHGVGFCQWGAVGRSRAGQSARQILDAYYPGATVERLY